jgi:hypothetical protein
MTCTNCMYDKSEYKTGCGAFTVRPENCTNQTDFEEFKRRAAAIDKYMEDHICEKKSRSKAGKV